MIKCPKCQHLVSDDAKFCGNCAAPLHPENIQSEAVAPQVEEVDPFLGKCIDNKYYITERIASGGMGVVYLAMQKGVGQEVAIKKLHSMYYQNPTIVERFINEARSYGKISHPNAVKLHDLLNVNGQICIVMEYVKGRTLTQYLQSGYLFSTRQIIDISLQLADALGTVNQVGIIHRDLKTENVMLLETVPGRFSVKILDFGIAKFLDKPPQQSTEAGLIVGTPEFMAPEQCFGHPVDNRVDIYAFGVLMYAMICGKLPFTGDSQMAVMQKQISAPVPPLVRPDKSEVHPGLEAIVLKCMMKAPDDRYSSFTEVIVDLECLQEGKQTKIALSSEFAVVDGDDSEDTSVWDVVENTTISKPDVISMTPQALKSRVESASKLGLPKDKAIVLEQKNPASDKVASSSKAGVKNEEKPGVEKPVLGNPHVDEEGKTQDNDVLSEDLFKNNPSEHQLLVNSENEDMDDEPIISSVSGIAEMHDSMQFSIAEDSDERPAVSESEDRSDVGLTLDGGDDEGFSLGDFDEEPLESRVKLATIESPEAKKTKSKALMIISIFALIIVVAGMSLWVLSKLGYVDLSGVREWVSNVFPNESEQSAVKTEVIAEPDVVEDDTLAAAQGEDEGKENTDDAGEVPEEAEVEASRVVSRDNIDRGVLRATIEYARAQSLSGAIDNAAELFASVDKQKSLLNPDEQTSYQALIEQNESFKSALALANKTSKSRDCDVIRDLITQMPEEAVAIRAQLAKYKDTCDKNLKTPPMILSD